MKYIYALLLITLCFSTGRSEAGKFSKQQEQSLAKFSALYDSLYTKKVIHGADSVRAYKTMIRHLEIFNK